MHTAYQTNELVLERMSPLESSASLPAMHMELITPLQEIIQQRKLTALFQPILNLKK